MADAKPVRRPRPLGIHYKHPKQPHRVQDMAAALLAGYTPDPPGATARRRADLTEAVAVCPHDILAVVRGVSA